MTPAGKHRVRTTGGCDSINRRAPTGFLARGLKLVAEALLREWSATRANDEGQVPTWSCLKGRLQHGQNRQRDLYGEAAFLRLNRGNAIAHMLATEPHRIATA